ncbi:MAG TPA: nitroreductase/quinone reductase family protein [Actinomycetes bacterium]|nr:nitroreductase/quinone reductase family protein [Actinomycetes bacterium]
MTRITSVDPASMAWRRRILVPLSNNRVGYWYLTRVAPRIDATLTPATGAWLSSVPGTPLLLLTTTGARSGRPRTTPLMFFSRGEDVILMASNFGRRSHPAWLSNVEADPEVTLLFRSRRGRYRARIAEGAEREELWATAKAFIANYRSYESRVADQRTIAVVVCSPLD